MTLNDEDLRVTEAKGQVRVITHSKNVDLSQIYGDTYVEDRDGNISIEPAGVYNVEAKSNSGKGDLELTLPPNASATVNAFTHNGDILSDYPVSHAGRREQASCLHRGRWGLEDQSEHRRGRCAHQEGIGFPARSFCFRESSQATRSAQRAAPESAQDARGTGDAVRLRPRSEGPRKEQLQSHEQRRGGSTTFRARSVLRGSVVFAYLQHVMRSSIAYSSVFTMVRAFPN